MSEKKNRENETRESLPSKKNFVYRCHGKHSDTVTKIFTDQKRFETEKHIVDLMQFSGIRIPERLSVDQDGQEIAYRYINGVPVVEHIEGTDLILVEEVLRKICAWLIDFYIIISEKKGCQYILGDIHLRNFLYEETSRQVYGIDFEECREGRIETDVARLYAFILHYDPALTPRKKMLAAFMLETMSEGIALDKAFFQEELARETEELLARRALLTRDDHESEPQQTN
jgi:predicted Ser/Thr protein kinase